jgi:alkanesulfonate monooxygenase SsuD/methylene tetrahydromethanopterin reductase-like flavin-dependent oxidoreductase (luciferase family)
MEIDIILEADLTPREVRELGLLAEDYGFRAIWTQNYARARDAFMIAVPLALASKRIRVGVLAVSAYEMHPLKIANAALTLNECAPAGACVVVGAGGEWPAIQKVDYGKRLTGTREALQMIKDAASGETVMSEGEVYHARGFQAPWSTNSDSELQVYAGTTGPQFLTMATEVADGAMMSDMQPEMFDWSMPALRKAIAENGRDDFRISNFLAWHVKEDRETSLHEARRELILRGFLDRKWLEPYLEPEDVELVVKNNWPFLNAFRDKSGDIEGVAAHIVDALVEGLALTGDYSDIDRHIERLRKFEDAGFTEIALRVHDDPEDSIRLIGQRVLREFQ